jgi:GTPase SAR1 family protein
MNTFTKADEFSSLVKSIIPPLIDSIVLVVLVGEASVGKTSLVHRIVRNQAPPKELSSTIGVEFSKKVFDIPSSKQRV